MHTLLHSVPLTQHQATAAHTSATDSWTFPGTSGSVSCGVTAPSFSVLGHTDSKSLLPQSCVSSGGSIVGLMATSSKRAYAVPRSAAPEPLLLQQATADQYLHMIQKKIPYNLEKVLWGIFPKSLNQDLKDALL